MMFINSKSKWFLILTVLCLSLKSHAGEVIDKKVHFYTGSFDAAKTKAVGEDKYLFVDFYADWCTPCKWMEETTFSNHDIVEVLGENFVSYKVDIDDPEGYKIKNRFEIKMLPTLLIFDQNGDLVERIEETLDAKKLLSVLNYHLQFDVQKINNSPNVSPKDGSHNSDDQEFLDNLYKEYKDKLAMNTRQYNAQVGIYTTYQEAFDQVNILKDQFLEQVIVVTEYKNGSTHYKVLLGEFETMEEASSFCDILRREHQLPAIVH